MQIYEYADMLICGYADMWICVYADKLMPPCVPGSDGSELIPGMAATPP